MSGRVNRQKVKGRELQTGRGRKGESCKVNRQRVKGRELQSKWADVESLSTHAGCRRVKHKDFKHYFKG